MKRLYARVQSLRHAYDHDGGATVRPFYACHDAHLLSENKSQSRKHVGTAYTGRGGTRSALMLQSPACVDLKQMLERTRAFWVQHVWAADWTPVGLKEFPKVCRTSNKVYSR